MLYSSAGLFSLIINLIINHDILFNRRKTANNKTAELYRLFLVAVNFYYVTDIIWGLLYEKHLVFLNAVDTYLYFLAMGFSILFWTMYAVSYLDEEKLFFSRFLRITGWFIFVFQIILLIVNFFTPCVFSFDTNSVYHVLYGRYITLALQIAMFILTALHAFWVCAGSSGARQTRHLAIGICSIIMGVFIGVQAIFPLFPVYAAGCMICTCILFSFVLYNEKEEYRGVLEQRLQESILHGNYYDLLTGMPGLSYFLQRVRKQRLVMLRDGKTPAFLFFDLSGMKFYNQKYGFSKGDNVLKEFSLLLSDAFGKEHCSRLGSDHFAAFSESDGLEDTVKNIFQIWNNREEPDLPAIRVGIYLDDGKTDDISTAVDRAKAARDTLRASYISDFRYFDDTMLEKAEHAQYITSHLDKAIKEGWIQAYFQPIIRAINGRVCDEEALARWNDPERGFLSPAEFIPVLEEAGLIYKLDLHILDLVLEKMKHTKAAGLHLVPQSINLSRSDFDSCDIVQEISSRTDQAGIPHHLISIEITESIIGSDFDFIKTQLERFRSLGFPVWMDDFGSGYSSLDVLSDMPVDLIKLDMHFMQKFNNDERSRIILTELMKMAIALGIDTICEGVETREQVEFLRDIGCSKLQGFYYTKPISLNDILKRYETGVQIGFENPEESEYYDAIGRINLYDVSILTHENADVYRSFFRTIPMGIVEMNGDMIRFSRCNPAYREFIEATFHEVLPDNAESFQNIPFIPSVFIDALKKVVASGEQAFVDETRPDGTVIRSFIRKITNDPVNGTTAMVVAVLSITSPSSENPISPLS